MEIPSDLIPIANFVKELPGRNSSATHELVFLASMLPAMGSKSYYIEVLNKSSDSEVENKTNETFIKNQVMVLNIYLSIYFKHLIIFIFTRIWLLN